MNRSPRAVAGTFAAVVAMSAISVAPAFAAGPLTQRCTNAEYEFTVSFPSDWFTNQPADVEGSRVAACTLFAPFADFEVLPEVVNVPIFLKHESGTPPEDGRAVTVDGRPGVLVETEVNDVAWYVYYVAIGEDTRFAGFAFDNGSAPFDESRAVLDAMIATIDLDGEVLPDVATPGPHVARGPISTITGLALLGTATVLTWRRRPWSPADRRADPIHLE